MNITLENPCWIKPKAHWLPQSACCCMQLRKQLRLKQKKKTYQTLVIINWYSETFIDWYYQLLSLSTLLSLVLLKLLPIHFPLPIQKPQNHCCSVIVTVSHRYPRYEIASLPAFQKRIALCSFRRPLTMAAKYLCTKIGLGLKPSKIVAITTLCSNEFHNLIVHQINEDLLLPILSLLLIFP